MSWDRASSAIPISRFEFRDLLVLGVGCYGMFRLLRPFTRAAAAAGVVLLATRYLVYGGAEQSLQRDWLVALLVIGGTAILLDGRENVWLRAGAGAVLGYACTIKPQAVIVLALVPVFLWLRAWSAPTPIAHRGVTVVRASIAVFAGVGAVIIAILGWLVVSGSWSDFHWMVTQYLPLYSKLDGNGFSYRTTHDAIAHAFTVSRGRPEVPLLSFGVAVLLLRRRPPEQVARLVAITLLLVWGFFYAVLGIKTWDYHYWPFIGASVAVVAVAFGDLQARRWKSWKWPPAEWVSWACSIAFLYVFARQVGFTARAVNDQLSSPQSVHFRDVLPQPWLLATFLPLALLAVADLLQAPVLVGFRVDLPPALRRWLWWTAGCVAMIIPLLVGSMSAASVTFDVTGTAAVSSPYVPALTDRDNHVAAMLRARSRPGDRVQILDTTEGGADIALRADLEPASRFIYDFHFFHDVGTAVNSKLRRELMKDLTRSRPRFVLFFAGNWGPRSSFEAISAFPELASFIAPYRVIYDDFRLRVLER